jgi:hypothetical protein
VRRSCRRRSPRRVGPDGRVAIFNFAGDVELFADVMGYFT